MSIIQKIVLPSLKTEVSTDLGYLRIRNMKMTDDYSQVPILTTGNKHQDQDLLNQLFYSTESMTDWIRRFPQFQDQ